MRSEIIALSPPIQLLVDGSRDAHGPIGNALTANGFRFVARGRFSSDDPTAGDRGPTLVLVNVTEWHEERTLRSLRPIIPIGDPTFRVLCFSMVRRSPRFVLKLFEEGSRYVRIADVAMLLEAVELILAESSFESKRVPAFRITHRFSQGTCGPGEEVAAVQYVRLGRTLQLRLSLAERLSFNLLAPWPYRAGFKPDCFRPGRLVLS